MKYEVIKRLWTDDRVWAYGFAFSTQRKCFLILCVPVVFVELTMGMKYSHACSKTSGKYLLLQKQISRWGRQRHSRKRRTRAHNWPAPAPVTWLIPAALRKKTNPFSSAFAPKCQQIHACPVSSSYYRKTPNQRDLGTKKWGTESDKKIPQIPLFPISVIVNTTPLFYFESCQTFSATGPPNASGSNQPVTPSVPDSRTTVPSSLDPVLY